MAVTAAFSMLAAPVSSIGGASAAQAAPSGADTRVIVVTDKGIDRPTAAGLARAVGGSVRHVYGKAIHGFAATVPAGQVTALERQPGIRFVEPDQRGTGSTAQSSTPSWGLDRVDQRARPLDGTYSYDSTGAGVTQYIVDSGVRLTHSEFTGRIRSGPDFVDDDALSEDCHGHGTHVAGTSGGTTFGIAKQANIVALRVLDCGGSGWYSDWIAAIDWLNADHAPGTPAVVNASLGGGYSSALNTAVRNSIADGIVWVIAAMNNSADACSYSPASVTEAVVVGATDSADTRASFSNYGACVDLFAPGVDIASAGTSSDTAVAPGWNGTSMATPHVTGAVSRYLETQPTSTPAQTGAAILAASTPDAVTDPLSANRLLYIAPSAVTVTAPGMATSVSAVAASATSATLSWSPPENDGGSAVNGYRVAHDGGSDGGTPWMGTVAATAMGHTFSDLRAGVTYHLSVSAINAQGTGPAVSVPVTMPAASVASAPSGVTAAVASGSTATLRWSTPTSSGGSAINGYRVAHDGGSNGGTPWMGTVAATARWHTFLNLRAGVTYHLSVSAINAQGTGPATSVPVTMPATAPGAPRIGTATPGASGGAITATTAWSPPTTTGGSTITGYRVRALRMSSSGTVLSTTTSALQAASARTLLMALPQAGNYRFTVQAVNAVGDGSQSARSNLVAGR